MPRKKKVAKTKTEKIDPNVEEIYEETITFTCPVRGLVTQKVKIKRYKPQSSNEERSVMQDSDTDLFSKIDNDDLSILTEEELKDTD
jgi:hypothetical protein